MPRDPSDIASSSAGGPARVFTRESARALDRLATDEFGVPTILLMENAAAGAARVALDMLGGAAASVLIVAGPGNNGGDGLAMARHLHNAGCAVAIALRQEPAPGTDAATNLGIVQRMRLPLVGDIPAALSLLPCPPALVVDALFGSGLTRPPGGDAASDITEIGRLRRAGALVLAVDIPSGLDCDTGEAHGPHVRADVTATFVGVKRGFLNPAAAPLLGRVVTIGIGVPRELIERLGA